MEIDLLVPEKTISKGLYHTWTWWPFRLYDPDAANKLSFPLPIETLHKIMSSDFSTRPTQKGWHSHRSLLEALSFGFLKNEL